VKRLVGSVRDDSLTSLGIDQERMDGDSDSGGRRRVETGDSLFNYLQAFKCIVASVTL
jgi:hypothetical protein